MEKIPHEIWKESFILTANKITEENLKSYLIEIGINTPLENLALFLYQDDGDGLSPYDHLRFENWPNPPATIIYIDGRVFKSDDAIELAKLIQTKHRYVCFDCHYDNSIQLIFPKPEKPLDPVKLVKESLHLFASKSPRLNALVSDLKEKAHNKTGAMLSDEKIMECIFDYEKKSYIAFFIYDEKHRERRGNLEDFKDLLESRSDLLHVRDWAPNWILKIQDDVFAPLPEWKPFENADKRKNRNNSVSQQGEQGNEADNDKKR